MLAALGKQKRISEFFEGVNVQRHVIGALILRELHTRYGRDNIGFLWLLVEPLLLAVSVAVLHVGDSSGGLHGSDIRPIPFMIGGYCVFMIFRSIVSRAETAIEANKSLLYHRIVTLFDIMISRAVLEILSSIAALVVLLGIVITFGYASIPSFPLTMLAGIAFVSWFSFALSMCVCALTYFSKAASKILHPLIYIMMPLSGCFFILRWIPEPYRTYLSWSPLNQAFEMVHSGHFSAVNSTYYNPIYISMWCMALTVAGLLCLRVLRRHIHLS